MIGIKRIFGVLVASLLVGCGPYYPLGISEAQWLAMSNEQRLQAQQRQAELDRAAEERRAAEARAREAEARVREAEALRKQQQLLILRQHARYGDRVQCIVTNAEARLGGKWRDVEPVVLDLVRGAAVDFLVSEPRERGFRQQAEGSAVFDGQAVSLCRDADSQRNSRNCSRLLGNFDDYRRGVSQRVEVHDFLRGNMRCSLAPGEGMPRMGGGGH